MPKITPRQAETTITVKTQTKKRSDTPSDWWNSNNDQELMEKLMGTVAFLKEQNGYRVRQASLWARLYGNMPLMGLYGSRMAKMGTGPNLPSDRPTMSVITSGIDTLVSRITQIKPRPLFLTDNGDYKQRELAKQLNQFIAGEFYQTKAYERGPLILRDAAVLGTGTIKILEDAENRVAFERRLYTETLIDDNDGYYGDPRMRYELKLIDRAVLLGNEKFSKVRSDIEKAEQGYPDAGADSQRTASDQIIVVEGWRLPSHPTAGDGLHVIACTEGVIFEEEWKKKTFPFVDLLYAPRMVGCWGQGLAERQMGTQMGINQLLITIHKSINLVGVPRVFVEKGSKVVKAHLNNEVGSIVEFSGTKPSYEIAPCVPVELYQQLERLIQFAYQQEGISQLAAQSQKPAGLNSGEAIRQYDDIQSDRFAALQRRYETMFVDLAYQAVELAAEIAKRDGKYETIYPNKDGTKEINLPDAKLLDDPFVIQCFDTSSLPREPAGRMAKITEWVQAGMYTPQEGRRLMGLADTEQEDKLLNAAEERILKILDQIVESGDYTPPDPFMDLEKANELVGQYYNLYMAAKLEESKAQMLRDFSTQVKDLIKQAMPPAPPAPGIAPQANPMPTPQSQLIPNMAGPT